MAGELFLHSESGATAPLSDDILPKPGVYFNADDSYYPHIYGVLIVFQIDDITTEVFISAAFHSIKTRRWNGKSWNEWA